MSAKTQEMSLGAAAGAERPDGKSWGAADFAWSRDGVRTPDAPIAARRPPFDSVTIGLHWTTVILVLALFATAWSHGLAEKRWSELAPTLLQIHRSMGVTIWFVTALRLAWRLTHATLPPFPAQMAKLHRAVVKSSEYGLYALLLGQPTTGLLMTLLSGRPFTLFTWRFPPLLIRDETLQAAFHFSHEAGAWVLGALAVGHAAAALFHHFVLRDDVLATMAPVIATASKQGLETGITLQPGNKGGPLTVLVTRRAGSDPSA